MNSIMLVYVRNEIDLMNTKIQNTEMFGTTIETRISMTQNSIIGELEFVLCPVKCI